MSREKVIYKQTYKKPYPTMRFLPSWEANVAPGCEIKEIQVLAEGVIEKNNKRYEFQNLKFIYGDADEPCK